MSTEGGSGRSSSGLSFRLGSIPVAMPWSGVAGIAVVAWLWHDQLGADRSDGVQVVLLAVTFALLFYVSILVHELAHAWSARALGNPVHGITLWIFGGYTSFERRNPSAWRDAVISVSGPVSSVLLGLVWWWLALSPLADDPRVFGVARVLALTNIFLGIYNALPGLPLDGGSVLRAILWAITGDERRATVIAAWSGRVIAVVVFVGPLWLLIRAGGRPNVPVIVFTGIVAAYLYAGASQALKRATVLARVPQLSVAGLLRRAILVAHDVPLAEAMRRLEEAGARAILVTDANGEPVAVTQEAAVSAVPLERRPWVPVSSVSASLDPHARLHVDLSGDVLLRAMQDVPASDYVVHDSTGVPVGVLHARDVEQALSA